MPTLREHGEQQVRGRPLPPIILHDPYPRRRRPPSPPATRRSPSGRVPSESSPSPPSPPTGAISVASPPAPASLSPRQFSQRRRWERECLHCDQSPSSPPSPTTVPVLTTSPPPLSLSPFVSRPLPEYTFVSPWERE